MTWADIEPFGQSIIKTPTLNALAEEGMRFTNFHVHATCSPTRAQMLTGVDNHLAGMGAMGEYHTPEMDKYPGNYIGAMNDRVETFAEVLKDRGYATFMSGKWHLGGKDEYLPPAKGFEKSFVLGRIPTAVPQTSASGWSSTPVPGAQENHEPFVHGSAVVTMLATSHRMA